jgi:hypothetical protein
MNKIAIAAAALCSILLTGAISTGTAMAAGPFGVHASADQSSLVQKTYVRRWHRGGWGYRRGWRRGGVWIAPGVVYGGGCVRARRVCAARWGWGGPGFRRCMWRHAC